MFSEEHGAMVPEPSCAAGRALLDEDVVESLAWATQMAVQDGADLYTWLYVRLLEPLTSIGDLFDLYRVALEDLF
ncbi:hypothetical protein AV530_011837 [Patagioenas fasciata monilis]|uniref:Uncharacterized protein n=1 Tax=Patagioenas fasciata monilis TaxID=372326 RepID=A0A1V4JU43_PATFA|nr:hypothetical protein AV530_011837 [Patagioenas fasciata monilis]